MEFLRRGWYKHKRIGKGKKRKVGWRKPKGRDNKMRESRKGKPPIVSIGYKKQKDNRKKRIIYSIKDLENANKNDIIILGKTGKKIRRGGCRRGTTFRQASRAATSSRGNEAALVVSWQARGV